MSMRISAKQTAKSAKEYQFYSEFNPTAFELARVNEIVNKILYYQELCFNIANVNAKHLLNWLAALRSLYSIIKPLLVDSIKVEKDKTFKEVKMRILDTTTYESINKINSLVDYMINLTDDLFYLRQVVGLGLYASEEKELAEKDLRERLL